MQVRDENVFSEVAIGDKQLTEEERGLNTSRLYQVSRLTVSSKHY